MAGLSLVLFDDRVAQDWLPFALTRPAGELLFGAMTQRARAERLFRARCLGHITSDGLAHYREHDAPPALALERVPEDDDVLFLSSRAVPEWQAEASWDRECIVRVGGEPAGWFSPAGATRPDPDFFLDPASAAPGGLPALDLPGSWIGAIWELVTRNAEQIERDIAHAFPAASPDLPDGVYRLGSHPVVLGEDVTLEPGVVLDLTNGPILLDDDVTVRALTRLAGPAYVGPESIVLGGCLGAVSIGPVCRIHGEVEASVVLGYTNKAHDGFLGHAYLGRWVNLGAMTTNSDLKNNYGEVRLTTPRGQLRTGEMKLGSLVGDHVKTGIGTLLNTGTIVGAGSNLYGTTMPPKYVPPFSWGTGAELGEYDVARFLATAETAMSRRGVELDRRQRELLRTAWERSREERLSARGVEAE